MIRAGRAFLMAMMFVPSKLFNRLTGLENKACGEPLSHPSCPNRPPNFLVENGIPHGSKHFLEQRWATLSLREASLSRGHILDAKVDRATNVNFTSVQYPGFYTYARDMIRV